MEQVQFPQDSKKKRESEHWEYKMHGDCCIYPKQVAVTTLLHYRDLTLNIQPKPGGNLGTAITQVTIW